MGAGKALLRKQAASRKSEEEVRPLALVPAPPQPIVGVKDAPAATLIRWMGENWADLLWGDVVAIMRVAETSGDTVGWGRLSRRMYTDGHLLACRGNRVDPIAGARWDVEPGGPNEWDILAAADVADMLKSLPDFSRVIDHGLDALFVGYSITEIIWEPRGSWVWPAELDCLQPHRFRFDQLFEPYLWDDGRLAGDPGANSNIQLMGKPLRERKFIIHMPAAIDDYPIAAGLLRACARYWWVKWWMIRYWLSGAEVAGNPRAIGKYPQAAADNVKNALYEALSRISADGVAAHSMDTEIEFVPPSTQGTGSIFDSLAKWADAGISKTILGSTLNVEVGEGGGNRALGESQGERTLDPRMLRDASGWWETIRRDLVKPFLEFNSWRYGGRMPALPLIRSVFQESATPTPDETAVDIGAVTIDEWRTKAGLPEWGPERGGDRIAVRKDGSAPAPVPGLPTAATGAEANVADTALNGAQVTSLQGMLAAVSAGQLAPGAAVIAISKAFPTFTVQEVEQMVNAQAQLPPPVDPASAEAGAAPPFPQSRRASRRRVDPWDLAMRIATSTRTSSPSRTPTG